MRNPKIVALLACLCGLLWASAAPVIKIGYRLLEIDSTDTASILLFAGCRFAMAGMLVILFACLKGKRFALPKRGSRLDVCKLALAQTFAQYLCFYIGVAHSSGVSVALINGTSPMLSVLIACYAFRMERMTVRKAVGCALGFAGIVMMNLSGAVGKLSALGEGAVLMSVLCGTVANSLGKRYTQKEDPAVMTGWQFLLGGLTLCAVGFCAGGRLRFNGIGAVGALFYLAALSAIAYTLWNTLLHYNDVSTVSVYNFMNPLFGVLISAALLGETAQAFRWTTLAALLLICCGLITINFKNKKAAKA